MKNKISDTKNIEWRIYPLEKLMLFILFLETMRTGIIVGKKLNKIFGMIEKMKKSEKLEGGKSGKRKPKKRLDIEYEMFIYGIRIKSKTEKTY